jgi:16S rRNA (guanine527-N7)-methyltransferase
VSDYAARIAERLAAAELAVTTEQLGQLGTYLELLAKWNRTINLTSFDLSQPSDGAIDRLVVESAYASQLITSTKLNALDVGSGGGSPSLPLKILSPLLSYGLVESRSRKCAFLREAVRVLGLADVQVEQARLEDVAGRESTQSAFDLVTMRAVRADERLWSAVQALLSPAGRVLWFVAPGETLPSGFEVIAQHSAVTLIEARARG